MKIYLYGGMLITIVVLFMTYMSYQQYKVERDGTIVKMQIIKMPNSCIGTKVKHLAHFIYNDVTYIKQVGGSFCDEHSVGEYIDIKYLEGESFILYPSESIIWVFYLFALGFLWGVSCVVYYYVKRSKHSIVA